MEHDDRGTAFKEAFLELMDTANEEQTFWALEWFWHFRRLKVIQWLNLQFLRYSVPSRE